MVSRDKRGEANAPEIDDTKKSGHFLNTNLTPREERTLSKPANKRGSAGSDRQM